jgi:hypothetical protein
MGHDQVVSPEPAQEQAQSLFISGYFTSRVKSGFRPTYGYPANHLPETKVSSMELVTSFMAKVEG